jgi:multisubunit Na+/H+ antiporter MnhB subunit
MKVNATVRNVLIILALAAVVAFAPGGGTGGGVVLTAVYLLFLAALGWVGSIVYRERRGSLYLLGDGRRALLYGAIMVLAVTLTATSRLWGSPAGSVAWLVLIGSSIYAIFAVIWAARRY